MTETQAPRPVVMVIDDDEGVHAALRLVLHDESCYLDCWAWRKPWASGMRRNRGPKATRSYGLRITRVAGVPVFLPCHSAISNALLISASGKLWETTFESGYLSFVRTRKSSALGMIHGL